MIALLGLVVALLAACIPAAVPPQLSQTPGPSVTITDRVDVAELFAVRYPEGWRLVTSPAGAPPTMLFVAPDDRALIMVSTDPTLEIPPLAALDTRSERRTLALADGVEIGATLRAPVNDWDAYLPTFERVVESIMQPE